MTPKLSYEGDDAFQLRLRNAGEQRPLEEIKSVIRGVLAAPEDLGDKDAWMKLFRATDQTLREQLRALKNILAHEAANDAHPNKLQSLRAEMALRGVTGFFVPRADEFQGEYVPARAERLAWITGFTGSAGQAVVLKDTAAFFTDGRYTLQAAAQVSARDFEICSVSEGQAPYPTISPVDWIAQNVKPGDVFGIDPWVHTPAETQRIKDAVEKAGGTLKMLDDNPLDAAWKDQPPAPLAPVVPHPLKYAGVSSQDKLAALSGLLATTSDAALAVTLPEEICWLLNIRGGDVPCTPFALSYALAHKDGTVDWFIDARKVTQETRDWVGSNVRLHPLENFADAVKDIAAKGEKVWIDPASAPVKIREIITAAGGAVHQERSPLQLMKAKKNKVEIDGTVNAHIRDGVAITRFLAAILKQGAAAKHDEISASDLLQSMRAEVQDFRGLSFDTISGAGPHGAIVHYRSSPESNQPLLAGPVYLCDSGGQYLDGTTDITRTVAVDNVTPEMKENFTRVLKGHIQVAMSVFPEGTTGDKLDVKARAALKEVGLDYAHGTGHGVGSYLSVHEGPCGISPRSTTVPLEPGMIISNEPGFYKNGEYGIRIENLVCVIDTGKTDAEGKKLLGFQTLTLAPIDRNLIEPALLTADELEWFNAYHVRVRETLLPLLKAKDPEAADFLIKATEPLPKLALPEAKKKNGFIL